MSGISFSFGPKAGPSKAVSPAKAPLRRTAAGFDAVDEDFDGEGGNAPRPSRKNGKLSNKNSDLLLPPAKNSTLSRQQKLRQQEAKALDASVFEYDEVYDDMKEAERKAKAAKDAKGQDRKPQYISGLIETAKQRQIDRQRAEDALVARERMAEGDDFADKDAFVTDAYKAQQEEFRRIEEEERKKAEKGPTNEGRAKFYKGMLDEESERHQAAVEAVAKAGVQRKAAAEDAKRGGSLGLSAILAEEASRPQNDRSQYDPEPEAPPDEAKVAAEASKRLGRTVELDDEGRIIDHRQLLTGGLNVGPPRKGPQNKTRGFALPIAERAKEDREKAAHAAREEMHEVGDDGLTRAEKLRMSRERQSRMLEEQLVELQERKRKVEQDELEEGQKRVSVKRNDESKVEEMKRKALERRKAREELVKGQS